jgi:two-component system, NtrC family, response regulator GlrR
MKEGKHVILYVDDDRDFLDSTKLVLESKGFIVETAESAEEGLKAFKRCNPDLIIADLMMEEVDAGTGLIKDLRLAGNKAPVYMLSSVGDQLHMSVDTAALGLCGVFQKPVNFENLVRTLQQKLG